MGTILTSYGEAAYDHEGYAAQVLDDGTLSGTYSSDTRPRMVGEVVVACDCGWTGSTRYPCADGDPLDEAAEELALAEWEHDHARPVLARAQDVELERLQAQLRDLAAVDLTAPRSPRERAELLARLAGRLERATGLARRLHDQAHEQAELEGGRR